MTSKVVLGVAAVLGLVTSAAAMPVAPPTSDQSTIRIAQGCGPGWYRGPYGGCRPMGYAPRYYAPPPGYYYAPRCWRGYYGWVCR